MADHGRLRPARRRRDRTLDGRQVLVVVAVALSLAALLDAPGLVETARSQPFGWRRTVALALVRPVAAVSSALRIDVPHRALSALRDLRAPGIERIRTRRLASRPGPRPAPAPTTTEGTVVAARAAPAVVSSAPAAPAEPMRPLSGVSMWVAGDSVSGHLGNALRQHAGRHGSHAEAEYRVSSGLCRPDVFDWPAYVSRRTAELAPEAVVLMFGANDNQGIRAGDGARRFGTPEWRAEYGRRVAAIMDEQLASGREVYWVGQPIMRDDAFSDQIRYINAVYLEQATARDGVTYVDAWSAFVDGEGRYSQYLPDEHGVIVKVRADDGVHLTPAGGRRLAAVVLRAMDERRRAEQPPPEPTPGPTPAPHPGPPDVLPIPGP